MKPLNLLPFVCLLSFTVVGAQPSIQWQKSLGGNNNDYPQDIRQATDGGYIIAGWSASNNGDVSGNHGSIDAWVVKVDSSANIQWQKSLGGSLVDKAYSVCLSGDEGYVVVGETYSNDGDVSGHHGDSQNPDVWVVKLGQSGEIQWQKSLGGNSIDVASSVQAASDSGIMVGGYTWSNDGEVSGNHGNRDFWILKLTQTGEIQWQKALGGSDSDFANSILATNDGGCIAVGQTRSNNGDVSDNQGGGDCWIIKLDQSGNLKWQRTLGGSQLDHFQSIQYSDDGGYIAAGYSNTGDGDIFTGQQKEFWVVKLNQSGEIQWQKVFGGTQPELASSIQVASEGGYIVAGWSMSSNGDATNHYGSQFTADIWIVKLADDGMLEWQKSLGGSGIDGLPIIVHANDGGYVFAGHSGSNNYDVTVNQGGYDFWVVKLNTSTGLKNRPFLMECSVFPNPATHFVEIRCSNNDPISMAVITDMFGRQQIIKQTDSSGRLDISSLPSGMYTLWLTTRTDKTNYSIFLKE